MRKENEISRTQHKRWIKGGNGSVVKLGGEILTEGKGCRLRRKKEWKENASCKGIDRGIKG